MRACGGCTKNFIAFTSDSEVKGNQQEVKLIIQTVLVVRLVPFLRSDSYHLKEAHVSVHCEIDSDSVFACE